MTSSHHHCALRVSDLDRAARFYIDALGGHLMVDTYVLDPDGNVVELVDAPMQRMAELTLEQFPEADPDRSATERGG